MVTRRRPLPLTPAVALCFQEAHQVVSCVQRGEHPPAVSTRGLHVHLRVPDQRRRPAVSPRDSFPPAAFPGQSFQNKMCVCVCPSSSNLSAAASLSCSVALLWPSEWEVISRLFIVDQPISIRCYKESAPSGPSTHYTTQPGKSGASRVSLSSHSPASWLLLCQRRSRPEERKM